MAPAPKFAFKGVDGAGLPQEGIITGVSKNAVMEELKNRGLQVMRLDEKKSGMKMELSIMPKRVKAGHITLAMAETRSSQPAELRRLIENADDLPQPVAA